MTNKQYEHVGRAMMLAAELARGVEGLRDVRDSFVNELASVIGQECARNAEKRIMTDSLPTWHLSDILNSITETIEKVQPKEVAK